MSEKKLYLASATIEFCVVADSVAEAERIADRSLLREIGTISPVGLCEITECTALPENWERDSRPYVSRGEEEERTAGEWLDEMKRRKAGEQ